LSDEQVGSARPGLKPGRWLLIAVVALLVAVAIVIEVRRDDPNPSGAQPANSPTPATSSSSPAIERRDCVPKISEPGVADPTKATQYGFVYASNCDQVVRELRFQVTAFDAGGKELVQAPEGSATGGVLFPGEELAVAGELDPPVGTRIASVKVEVTHLITQPPSDFSAWGHATVDGLTRGTPGPLGNYEITGALRGEPASAPLCVHEYVLIAHDSSGKVVYARALSPSTAGNPVTFPVPAPKGLDLTQTTIYAPQLPGTQTPPTAGLTCDGRKLS
jgi:hypothetical protein